MLNPIQLAQQERSQQHAIAIQQRIQRQRAEDNASTQTGFWRAFDPAQGLHLVELADGSQLWAESSVPTGFNNGEIVVVARAKGAVPRIRRRK